MKIGCEHKSMSTRVIVKTKFIYFKKRDEEVKRQTTIKFAGKLMIMDEFFKTLYSHYKI